MKIEKELRDNEIRLREIEFLLYKSDDKESRFDEIHKALSEMVTPIIIKLMYKIGIIKKKRYSDHKIRINRLSEIH